MKFIRNHPAQTVTQRSGDESSSSGMKLGEDAAFETGRKWCLSSVLRHLFAHEAPSPVAQRNSNESSELSFDYDAHGTKKGAQFSCFKRS